MTDYGLVVKNNNEEIQIDSINRNLSLDEFGIAIAITNNNTINNYYTRITIAPSSLIPLILIRPNTDDFVVIRNYHKTGSNFSGIDIVTMWGQTTNIDWKSYRENRIASGENYALLVYNSAGELCFDSGKEYFKIHSIHNISLAAPSNFNIDFGDYENITHAGISNPYYILSPNSSWVGIDPPPQVGPLRRYLIGIKKLTSTSVRVGWFATYHYVNPIFDYTISEGSNPAMKLIVCDAT